MTNRRRSSIYDNEYDEFLDELLEDLPDDAAMRRRIGVLKQWEHPNQRANATKRVQAQWADPNFKQAHSQRIKDGWNEESRAYRAALTRDQFDKPEKHPRYLGPVVGINIDTGEQILLKGNREQTRNGFNHAHIIQCIQGERESHAGYRWKRLVIDEKGNEQLIGKDYVSKLKLRPKIVGINTTTGERIEFPLLKDARAAGYHPSHLGNALKTGQPYRGYTWSKT